MKSREQTLLLTTRILAIIGIFTLICTGIFFFGYVFEEKPTKISVREIIRSPIRLIKSFICSCRKGRASGPYVKGLAYLIRKFNPFDNPTYEIEEEEIIYEEPNKTIIVQEIDPAKIDKLRELIRKIQESEKDINETLNIAESEVAKLKELIKEIDPKATKEEIIAILNKLSKFNKDTDKLIDDIIKQIEENKRVLWKEHEVALYYLADSRHAQFSGIFNKSIKLDDREAKELRFRLDHPSYINKLWFDKVPGKADGGLVTNVVLEFLSYGKIMKTISTKTTGSLVLDEPLLVDCINVKIQGYSAPEGKTTKLTTFHVMETAIGASK